MSILENLFGFHQCPWDQYEPTTIYFCEERLCSWVTQPGNAWSCLAFVIVGGWIMTRHNPKKEPLYFATGIASVLVGWLSFVYHATNVLWGEFLDLGSMYFLSGLMIAFGVKLRWPMTSYTKLFLGVGALLGLSFLALFQNRHLGIPIFVLQLFAALWLNFTWRKRNPGAIDAAPMKQLLACFALSFAFWVGDVTRLVCDPTNHFSSGHTIWHILNATCVALYYRYLLQHRERLSPESTLAVALYRSAPDQAGDQPKAKSVEA